MQRYHYAGIQNKIESEQIKRYCWLLFIANYNFPVQALHYLFEIIKEFVLSSKPQDYYAD